MTSLPTRATALIRIARNVSDLDLAQKFYSAALGFEAVSDAREDPALAALLGVEKILVLRMCSGGQQIELSQCFPPGAPYHRADANLVYFQHIALLATDIHDAYCRALAHGAEAISTAGPVQLPPASGGVWAVKFRDPDGHPLEFIQKPAAGYDHSAISVADVARSVAFYGGLGVLLDARQVNQGPAQDALDGIANARLDVVALRPDQPTPHVELLCYTGPKALPVQWALADLCADRLVFAPEHRGLQLLRDPDGHVIILDGR